MILRALINTYNPPSVFFDKLLDLKKEFDQLIIIDNGSSLEIQNHIRQTSQKIDANIKFVFNETNLGEATVLNQGFSWAIDQGSDFIFVINQDSQPAFGMVRTLLDTFLSHKNQEQIAIVAPVVKDSLIGRNIPNLSSNGRFRYKRTECTEDSLENVSIVITSGALYNLNVYKKLGPFRDEFFIDYVDTEYCLRAKQCGYDIIVACKAHLYHRLGNQQTKQIGPFEMHPTYHSPLRWYYISRNRIPMYRLYAFRFPYWLLYELIINSYGLVRLLLFEDQKINKLLAMLLGTLDGLNRHMGPISNSRKALIAKGN
jgi:rhamnosyltransferase